jgi:hypothetical protein
MKKNAAKRLSVALLMAMAGLATATAQSTIGDVRVINEIDTVWHFGYEDLQLYSRPIHRIDIAYPSSDIDGNPIELSGYVAIPADLYSGEQPVDGILLYNHYTQLGYAEAPTRGYALGEDGVIANPLRPNYIVVSSDFYGFGITEGPGQYYCYGTANGQASIDCLLAARKLLDQRGISQGRLLVNAGYSSGGYDAIATQKVRDMHYRDQISFDKTVVGGFPFDLRDAFTEYVNNKDDSTQNVIPALLILDSYNRHAGLELDIPSLLNEPVASHYNEWICSGQYSTIEILKEFKGLSLADVMKDTLYRADSPLAKKLKKAMRDVALENDWEPDTLQNYSVFCLLKDNIVPISTCRAFANFLVNYYYDDISDNSPLFKKSIIPEKTHLQTNFIVNAERHTLVGGILYILRLASTLAALPVLYYDGELNTHYADLVKDLSVMQMIHKLESLGVDVKGIVQQLMANSSEGGGGFFELLQKIDQMLKPLNLTTAEVLMMADDCGLSMEEMLQIYAYLTATDSDESRSNGDADAARPMLQKKPLYGTPDYYMFFLENWLQENNVDIYKPETLNYGTK